MLKRLSQTTRWFVGIIAIVVVITIIIMAMSGNQTPSAPLAHYINDNASADNKVEALKTMTANLLAVENKNKQLQKAIQSLQTQNKASMTALKESLSQQVQQALKTLKTENQRHQQTFEASLKQKTTNNTPDYPIKGNNYPASAFIWITDLSRPTVKALSSTKSHDLSTLFNRHSTLLPDHDETTVNKVKKTPVKPVYTIPVNATLTGATLMTPLVGRIPIDGKLSSPYHFKVVLSARNLTANGYPMPGVKGAVMSGIASGDMLGSCARGALHSITFIFTDGTISTTQAKGSDNALGYLSSQTGNPCIRGTFHSNAAIFLGAQMALAGAEGYANALSSSQYMNSVTPEGATISTLMGNANKAAIGQGMSGASLAAQRWWNQRVQNSFDYVYVANTDTETGRSKKVVVNITRQIAINHNPNARKVNYEDALSLNHRKLD